MSSFGFQLYRAWVLSTDSNGKPIRPLAKNLVGTSIMPVRETRPHALSRATVVSGDDEVREARERALAAAWETLTEDERRVLDLQRDHYEREVKETIRLCELGPRLDAGWLLVSKNARSAVVVKSFVATRTYEEIGELMGLTVSQVHSRVKRAHRKLRVARW